VTPGEIDASEIQRAAEGAAPAAPAAPPAPPTEGATPLAAAPAAPPPATPQSAEAPAPSAAPPPPPAAAELPPPPATVQAPAPAEAKVMDAEWPYAGYTGPQPWEAENPPALTQNHLMISSGFAGPAVVELAGLLAHLGFGTSISAGQNPHAIYDSGVSDAVRAFCQAYGVVEDPAVRAARTEDTVGPWIWEALCRAVLKKVAAEGTA
jgi:hypothetical protein